MVALTRSRNTLVRVVALATIAVLLTAATNVILSTNAPDYHMGTPGDDKINGLGGTDTVRVFRSYALPSNVENLTVAGTGDGS
jgi:hypothetical protein